MYVSFVFKVKNIKRIYRIDLLFMNMIERPRLIFPLVKYFFLNNAAEKNAASIRETDSLK